MRLNLTDLAIRKLQPPETGQVRYFDESTPGFGLTVGKRSKTFIVMAGKSRQLTTIGRYPDISLSEARKHAKRLLAQNTPQKATTRLREAVTRYLADIQGSVRPKTHEEYSRYLKNPPDIDLADLSTDHVASGPHSITAWKVFANWCIRKELLVKNPFNFIPVQYGKRSRVLSDAEIKAIWQYEHPPYSDIIKLCLITGQRVGEVTKFQPSWIDASTITIPSSVAKNGTEHSIPFNLLTAKYLRRYQGQSFNGFSKAKARMDDKTGVTGYVVHDIRRTFATLHAKLGTPIPVVEALLNHRSGTVSGVAAIYIKHNFLAEARKANLIYEQHIAKLVGAEA